MARFIRQQSFDVYRPGSDTIFGRVNVSHVIDTVFYNEHPKMTVEEVRKSLIEHDGYPSDIIVKKGK